MANIQDIDLTIDDFRELSECDCKTLLGYAKEFRDYQMNPLMREAVQIVVLNYIISQLTGNDIYTLDELLAKEACCECVKGEFDHDAIFTFLLWLYAVTISQSAPTGGDLIEQACRLLCNGKSHKAMLTPLWCEFFKGLSNPI